MITLNSLKLFKIIMCSLYCVINVALYFVIINNLFVTVVTFYDISLFFFFWGGGGGGGGGISDPCCQNNILRAVTQILKEKLLTHNL